MADANTRGGLRRLHLMRLPVDTPPQDRAQFPDRENVSRHGILSDGEKNWPRSGRQVHRRKCDLLLTHPSQQNGARRRSDPDSAPPVIPESLRHLAHPKVLRSLGPVPSVGVAQF